MTGLDAPRIYVAAGGKVPIVRLANDQNPGQGAYVESTMTPPGTVDHVAFDPSTTFVHLIGWTPDGTSPTVYVVETHGNSIFADARLPFDPKAAG